MASLEVLPIEINENNFLYCLTASSFEFPNRVCWTYDNAINALPVFKHFQQMGLAHLPRIYISACDYLPKPRKNGELVANIQRLTGNFGSASGIVMELKRIVQSRFWDAAWLLLLLKTMDGILSKTFSGRKRIKLLF